MKNAIRKILAPLVLAGGTVLIMPAAEAQYVAFGNACSAIDVPLVVPMVVAAPIGSFCTAIDAFGGIHPGRVI